MTSVTQIARRGERRLRVQVPDAKSIHAGDVLDGLTPPSWLGSGSVVVGDVGPNVKEARGPGAWSEAVPGVEPRDLRAAQGFAAKRRRSPTIAS